MLSELDFQVVFLHDTSPVQVKIQVSRNLFAKVVLAPNRVWTQNGYLHLIKVMNMSFTTFQLQMLALQRITVKQRKCHTGPGSPFLA